MNTADSYHSGLSKKCAEWVFGFEESEYEASFGPAPWSGDLYPSDPEHMNLWSPVPQPEPRTESTTTSRFKLLAKISVERRKIGVSEYKRSMVKFTWFLKTSNGEIYIFWLSLGIRAMVDGDARSCAWHAEAGLSEQISKTIGIDWLIKLGFFHTTIGIPTVGSREADPIVEGVFRLSMILNAIFVRELPIFQNIMVFMQNIFLCAKNFTLGFDGFR